MKKLITALLLIATCAFAIPTVIINELVLSTTSSNTAVLNLQLIQTTNLVTGAWTNAGDPVRWEIPMTGSAFFKVRASGKDNIMGKPNYLFEKLTTSSDAVPSALQGSVYWWDTGENVNNENVYYDASDAYALWNDGTNWLISAVADVDGSPTDYFIGIPDIITVSGAGESGPPPEDNANGIYAYDGFENDAPKYERFTTQLDIKWSNDFSAWTIFNGPTEILYAHPSALKTDPIPKTGWSAIEGASPAPTLAYETPSETFTGFGTFSGTLTLNEYTISEAWNAAELEVYTSLKDFFGNTDEVDSFRGYLPISQEGNLKKSNVWMIESGGTAGEFDPERTYGMNGNWCNVLTNAEIAGVFESRIVAMNFASSILAWLKETNNLNAQGNVTWCRMRELPQTPEEIVITNHRYWQVKVPLEILYLTESVHA